MENERKVRIISLVAVVVAVIGLTIAFAAMSRTLNIKGSTSVDPVNFDIHFKNITLQSKTETASVTGTPTPSSGNTSPTINNMVVTLSQPNDSVTYTVDIENEGDVDAEINNITLPTLTNAQSQLFDFTVLYTDNNTAPTQGDMLGHGEVRNITIVFKYKDITDENLLPDEPLTFNLSYSIEYIQSNSKVTTMAKTYSLGEKFCLNGQSECFYTITDNGTTVTALAEYNINTNTNSQSSSANTLSFSSTNYWYENGLKSNYGSSYPAWVFDSNSNLWTPIQNYQTYLTTTLGKTSVAATLMSKEQADALKTANGGSLPTWSYGNGMYWLGSARSNDGVWGVGSNGSLSYDYYDGDHYGLRPVITISKSDI